MPQFGKSSQEKLSQLHPDLKLVLNKAIEIVDFTVTTGYRGEEEQNKAFAEKKSKVKFPDSKHNKKPSLAVDIAPVPVDWKDTKRFIAVAFLIKGIAYSMGIKLRIGADWNGDFIFNESFLDVPHLELDSKLVNSVWVKY
jgi:peptidoglycan LD-endopeptidase CwlK